MELQNLNTLGKRLRDTFRSQFIPDDIELPEGFKSAITENGGYHYSYKKYMVHLTSDKLEGYIPNTWFYIASYFVEYYDEVLKYKELLIKTLKNAGITDNTERDNWLTKYPKLVDEKYKQVPKAERNAERSLKCQEEAVTEIAKQFDVILGKSNISTENKSLLKNFVSDYRWWFGGKTIDRGDFYVSPILTLANVINESHSYIAGLCKFLSDNKEAAALLRHPNAIIIKSTLSAFFIDVFTYLYENENKLEKLFSHLVPGSKGSFRYAYDNEGLRQTNFFVKGEENFKDTRKGDFYEKPFLYNDEKYYLSLELTKSGKETSNEVSFDGIKPILESLYPNYSIIDDDNLYILICNNMKSTDKNLPKQIIYYGAPGTGKSHETEEKIEKIYPDKEERKKNVFRTTFHPDSDYSTFVGAYKPFIDTVERFDTTGHYIRYQEGPKKSEVIKEERITYKFVPQAFTKAFIRAYELLEVNKPVFLVIEEINRGNCAQIFGDLFQLLDRDDNGYSKYAIKPDTDLGKYLVYNLGDKYDAEEGMKLPPNLYIRATMNTSDQSLFPIDSAFKRRWEWKYVPISKNEVNYKIEVENNGKLCHYDWWEFLDKVNTAIGSATTSEDKKLGYFFCKADKKAKKDDTKPSIITADKFVGKVIFYIWNDVFKDYGRGDGIFTYTYKEEEKKGQSVELSLLSTMIEDKEVDRTFSSFFDEKGDANHKSIVKLFEDLKIEGKEVGNSGSEEETTAD